MKVHDEEEKRVSRILNIKPIGTCEIMVQACRQDSITSREGLQILDELVTVGFRIDSTVYRLILNELGLSL